MLTPFFEARQCNEYVILKIKTPFIKISEVEVDINGEEFKFHCHPYFLWLKFSGEIIENGNEKAQYDVDTGTFIVQLPKKTVGEHFDNLGMLTTLLANRKQVEVKMIGAKPLIEVVGEEINSSNEELTAASSQDGDDVFKVEEKQFDWTKHGASCTNYEIDLKSLEGLQSYGFTGQHSGVFTKLKNEIPNFVDVPDPDNMSLKERRLARTTNEQESFDPSHYLADLFEDDGVQNVLKFDPPWIQEFDNLKANKEQSTNEDILSKADKLFMKDLPNKEYLIDHQTERSLYLGLIDIIFAFAYDYRVTEGDSSVESAWNICKLSSTLSWFDVFCVDVQDVLVSCMRRCLCFPLYRNWELVQKVMNDTVCILRLGKYKVLQCLISLHKTFNSTEPYYFINNFYITDYCIWIQSTKNSVLDSLADEIEQLNIDKTRMEFDLPELEEAGRMVLMEEEQSEQNNN